jgi:uncharacterized membrane protein YecN with MAPEG domain
LVEARLAVDRLPSPVISESICQAMTSRLTLKQRGVLRGMLVGAAITIVVIAGAILAGPRMLSREATLEDCMAFALRADAFVALWLAISIGLLARHRFFTPEDIDGGGLTEGTAAANILQATLQNTLEQAVLAVLVHLAWAVFMPVTWMMAIPAAVVLFLAGRVLFVRGYHAGAPSRAIGFTLTFYPSVLMIALVIGAAVWSAVDSPAALRGASRTHASGGSHD